MSILILSEKINRMKKIIVLGGGILFAMIMFSMTLNNYLQGNFYTDKISIVLTGKEGSKVLSECYIDGRIIIQAKTLPAKFTLQGSHLRYKIALLDAELDEPFEIKVMKNNKNVLTTSGKGVKGELKSSRSGMNLLFFNFAKHSSSVTSSNMSDDEAKFWVASKI